MSIVVGYYSITLESIKPSEIDLDIELDQKYMIEYRQSVYHFCYIPVGHRETYWTLKENKIFGKDFELPYEMQLKVDSLDLERKNWNTQFLFSHLGQIFIILVLLFFVSKCTITTFSDSYDRQQQENLIKNELESKLKVPKIKAYYEFEMSGNTSGSTIFQVYSVEKSNICFLVSGTQKSIINPKSIVPIVFKIDDVDPEAPDFDSSYCEKICIDKLKLSEMINLNIDDRVEISEKFAGTKFSLRKIHQRD